MKTNAPARNALIVFNCRFRVKLSTLYNTSRRGVRLDARKKLVIVRKGSVIARVDLYHPDEDEYKIRPY